jgi:hypothetical protein
LSVRIYKRGDRGFHGYGKPMRCEYRTEIEVYESSSASGPHVWLSLKVDPTVLRQQPSGEAVAHMNAKQARDLIARLQTFVDEIPKRWKR